LKAQVVVAAARNETTRATYQPSSGASQVQHRHVDHEADHADHRERQELPPQLHLSAQWRTPGIAR
jgi:hypothetical protein